MFHIIIAQPQKTKTKKHRANHHYRHHTAHVLLYILKATKQPKTKQKNRRKIYTFNGFKILYIYSVN